MPYPGEDKATIFDIPDEMVGNFLFKPGDVVLWNFSRVWEPVTEVTICNIEPAAPGGTVRRAVDANSGFTVFYIHWAKAQKKEA